MWFTGQSGIYGRVDPATNDVKVWQAPRGRGPYGITTTPSGDVYYASLAGLPLLLDQPLLECRESLFSHCP